MRIGALCPLHAVEQSHAYVRQGFEFIELTAGHQPLPPSSPLPQVPLIWQCPDDLPTEHPDPLIRKAVLDAWLAHLACASEVGATLMVIQFRRPAVVDDKPALVAAYTELLLPLSQQTRQAGVQLVVRNSPDNRDQLQLLREIIRAVPGLGLALDVAYAQHQVVKNLTNEYLWDSDLSPRLAHLYVSEPTGDNSRLRLPLGSLGTLDWARLVRVLKERYRASVTIDVGSADVDYLAISRAKWQAWWSM